MPNGLDIGAGQLQTLIATLQNTNTQLGNLFQAFIGGPGVPGPLGPGSLYSAITGVGHGGIVGVSDGSNAAPGFVGEYTSLNASSVLLTSTVVANVVTLPLSAVDWDLWGNANMTASVGASALQASISATSANIGSILSDNNSSSQIQTTTAVLVSAVLGVAPCRFTSASPMTAYLVCLATFASGTVSVNAKIAARRRR